MEAGDGFGLEVCVGVIALVSTGFESKGKSLKEGLSE
jgi:hypothetical protein